MRKYSIFILFLLSFVYTSVVFWEPEIPVPGGDITIYYNTSEGSLPEQTNPAYIHLGHSGWLEVQDYEMVSVQIENDGTWWKFLYQIPEEATTIDFVFTDLNGNWDNNGGYGVDWHISLNYYWSPYNPGPNDNISIVLQNVLSQGQIGWTLDDGNGFKVPHQDYWPEGSYVFEDLLLSPLVYDGNNLSIQLGPFSEGFEIPSSIKFKILWEDGTWDAGANGQIMLYDIYFNYDTNGLLGEVDFTSPQENSDVVGPVNISCEGDVQSVQFWVNGLMIGEDDTNPYEVIWEPESSNFGNQTVAARIVNDNDLISYSFLDFNLLYSVINEAAPGYVKDGVTINDNTVTIALYAPNKEYISIKGSWNSEYPNGEIMKLSGDSLWWYEKELEDGNYNYQYNINGEKLIADPWSTNVKWENSAGSQSSDYSEAHTLFSVGAEQFNWTDQNFEIHEMKDVILYELHIGDFGDDGNSAGTYQHLISKIEEGYFSDLGITTLELMPVNEFEGGWSWGYNPSFYMAPENSYGSPEDLKRLINTAHNHDLSVILDVVYNHLWGSSPLFQLYQPSGNFNYQDHNYVDCPYFHNQESEWGYKLQHWHDIEGRKYRSWKYVKDALFHWVNEYHFDGFRFDVTWGIGWGGNENGSSFYANQLRLLNPDLILIAEEDNATQVNNSDFNSCWDFSYHHEVFDNIMGYSNNMNYLGQLLDPFSQGYNNLNGPVTYTTSHDEQRIVYEAQTYLDLSMEDAYKLSKLGISLLMTSPGTPMIYHGQEFGQNSPRELNAQPLQWDNLSTESGYDLYNFYKNIINIRKENTVFTEGDYELLMANNNNSVLVFKREFEGQSAYMMFNFGNDTQSINIDAPNNTIWYEFISQSTFDIDDYFSEELLPKSVKIFTNFEIGVLNIDEFPQNISTIKNFPNPFNGKTKIEINIMKPEHIKLNIFDITGRNVENIYDGYMQSGITNFYWDPNSSAGKELSSGIYFLKLYMENNLTIKKIMYLK
jgi:1,4-alpha-glucan branching enzyme